MPHPFKTAETKVMYMRRKADLLEAVDSFASPVFLLQRAIEELGEYAQEQEKYGSKEYDVTAAKGEFDDIFVFYVSWLATYAPKVDMLQSVHTANGYGNQSAALDQLAPVILDSLDNPERAVPEVIKRLASIGMYMPVPYVGFSNIDATTRKVLSNRPPKLYTAYCPVKRRVLKDEELIFKYTHLEKGTRLIRQAVGRTLRVTDWLPYYTQLVDWTQSDAHLAYIASELKKADGKMIE